MAKVIGKDELAKHNKKTDIWIAISGKVYDVTRWLDDHPGGVEVITNLAGSDATEDFEDTGHSDYAYDKMKEFQIGSLKNYVPSEKKAKSTGQEEKASSGGDYLVPVMCAVAAVAVAAFVYRKKLFG